MPRKDWRKLQAMHRQMEEYRLPKNDTEDENLVKKAQGEDANLAKKNKHDSEHDSNNDSNDDSNNESEDENLVKKSQGEDVNLAKKYNHDSNNDSRNEAMPEILPEPMNVIDMTSVQDEVDECEQPSTSMAQGYQYKKCTGSPQSSNYFHENVTPVCVQGTFDQSHPRFGAYSGRQCVANCTSAMLFNTIKDISSWDTHDLDTVLCAGNVLYEYILNYRTSTSRHAYLLVDEIPRSVPYFDQEYTLEFGESLSGFVMKDTNEELMLPQVMCLDAALQTVFSKYNSTFVTFGEATFAVMERNQKYYVFDSHSRNAAGLQVPCGTSVLMKYTNLLQVYEHCLNLALSRNLRATTQFELTGMSIISDIETHGLSFDNQSETTANESNQNDHDDVHNDAVHDNSQDGSVEIIETDEPATFS